MSSGARVTVGLPVLNGAAYLSETIASILGQDRDDLELIIGDNGSGDETEEICRAAASDRRVRYVRSLVNRGAAWNYNRLAAMAETEYFKWAAHDDLLAPSFLRSCIEELDRFPEAVVAYPQTVTIDSTGAVIDPDFDDGLDLRSVDPRDRFRRYLLHPGEQHAVFGVIRTSSLKRTGMIANCWGGDVVLLASLVLQGPIHEVPRRLFFRRYHAGTSLVSNATPGEVARWFDPNKRSKVVLPRTRITVELAKIAAKANLPLSTKLSCAHSVALHWVPKYSRVIGGELKCAARAALLS